MDAFVMLQELLEQEQFELIFPERSISGQPDIRLVYLMNDAVESLYDYLGGEYCTPEERKLAMLVDFPPLNYCCYPAVPEQYSNCKRKEKILLF